jgi:putative transposase
VRLVCRALGYAPSSFSYQHQTRDEEALKATLVRLAGAWPTYGRPRLTAMLQCEGWVINHKRVGRLMHELGLVAHQPARKQRTTNSEHRYARWPNLVSNLEVVRPDQVWVGDITSVKLQRAFVYLAVLMDVSTRSIRGWQLGRNLDRALSLTALRRALQLHRPEIHHSDQGVPYANHDDLGVLQSVGAQISMAAVGEPTENGSAERLMRTIKEEHIELAEYHDVSDAYRQIGRFLDEVYQHKRIHSSLGYVTPAEFESQWFTEQQAVVQVEMP